MEKAKRSDHPAPPSLVEAAQSISVRWGNLTTDDLARLDAALAAERERAGAVRTAVLALFHLVESLDVYADHLETPLPPTAGAGSEAQAHIALWTAGIEGRAALARLRALGVGR